MYTDKWVYGYERKPTRTEKYRPVRKDTIFAFWEVRKCFFPKSTHFPQFTHRAKRHNDGKKKTLIPVLVFFKTLSELNLS